MGASEQIVKMKMIKRTALFGLFFLLNLTISNAQQPLEAGTFVIKEITYQVTKSEMYPSFSISRSGNPKLPENKQVVNNIALDYIKTRLTNEDRWKQLVKAAIGSEKVRSMKHNKEALGLTFYLRPDGKAFFILYKTNTPTVLSIEDIAKIDRVLMENYRATFTSFKDGHQYLSYIYINSELNFADE